MNKPTPPVEATAADRDAAWPYRPSCYKADNYTDWMVGKYDLAAAIIRGFARHRIASTRTVDTELLEALKAIERLPNYRCVAADMRKIARSSITKAESGL